MSDTVTLVLNRETAQGIFDIAPVSAILAKGEGDPAYELFFALKLALDDKIDLPVPFVFGFFNHDDKYGPYIGLVAKPFWDKNGYLDDQTAASSANAFTDASLDEIQTALEPVYEVLGAETMESTYESNYGVDETREKLLALGLKEVDMSHFDLG